MRKTEIEKGSGVGGVDLESHLLPQSSQLGTDRIRFLSAQIERLHTIWRNVFQNLLVPVRQDNTAQHFMPFNQLPQCSVETIMIPILYINFRIDQAGDIPQFHNIRATNQISLL